MCGFDIFVLKSIGGVRGFVICFEIGIFLEKDVIFKCLLGLKGFVTCCEKRNFRFELKMGGWEDK